MNRNEAIAAARAAGYTHVATAGGWVRLQDWLPYGCTKDQPVWASKDFPNFTLIDEPERPRFEDTPIERKLPAAEWAHKGTAGPEHERVLGIWRLRKDPA